MYGMRFFNTAGPMKPTLHYCIPPLERLDSEQVMGLIQQQKYFVLHAPRQTGKTSTLLALQDELNAGGRYRSVYVNVEVGQSAREDVAAAMQAILGEVALAAEFVLDDLFVRNRRDVLEESGPHGALRDMLSRWSAADPKPLVLLIDEIDALVGDTLVSVLRQLRAGYAHRPNRFPHSVILCGIRDIRDYRIHASAEKTVVTGGSAFNIKSESLRMGDFSAAETQALLTQHSEATGQAWTEAARQEIWRLTQGQPWLVNALAYRKTVIECKLLHGSLARTTRHGLEQTRAYMDRCTAEAGHLVIFDRTAGRSWDDKIFRRTETAGGLPVTVWGM